jgi:uncharacterized membrane protein YeiH
LNEAFSVPQWFDYGATFLFAISGTLLAIRSGYDIFGAFVLAALSSTGGGLLRDGVFLQDGPPLAIRSGAYLEIIFGTVLAVILVGRFVSARRTFGHIVTIVDAIALGAYGVVGVQLAQSQHIATFGLVVVGTVNAVGGGALRDIIMGKEVALLRPGELVGIAAAGGCALYVLLTEIAGLNAIVAAWITIATVFVVRMLSTYLKIETRALLPLGRE